MTNTNNIIEELKKLAKKVSTAYQEQLRKQKINASGALGKSTYDVQCNNNKYEIIFNLPNYWDIVEYGRRKGKFPPPDAIKKWIRVKRLIPSGKKKISQDSLSYLIGRKISKQGIPGRHPLEKSLDGIDREFDGVAEDITNILTEVLEDTLNNLIKK